MFRIIKCVLLFSSLFLSLSLSQGTYRFHR
jgi:hypothetical protein